MIFGVLVKIVVVCWVVLDICTCWKPACSSLLGELTPIGLGLLGGIN